MQNNRMMVKGAQFNGKQAKFDKPKAKSFFRPTTLSVPLSDAGVIPAPHMIAQLACTALVRSHHDTKNLRASIPVAF